MRTAESSRAMSFPRKREPSAVRHKSLGPRFRGDDGDSQFSSFPRTREPSAVRYKTLDPRVRGDDGGA